jgi:hypothetical protein
MPSSKANYREVDAVTIVDLSGTFILCESSAVRKAILDLTGKRKGKIILNFFDVTSIAYAEFKRIEGRVRLLNPPKKVCDILELTQLTKVFQVYADEPSAPRSFY